MDVVDVFKNMNLVILVNNFNFFFSFSCENVNHDLCVETSKFRAGNGYSHSKVYDTRSDLQRVLGALRGLTA